jgi:hypothetical protein
MQKRPGKEIKDLYKRYFSACFIISLPRTVSSIALCFGPDDCAVFDYTFYFLPCRILAVFYKYPILPPPNYKITGVLQRPYRDLTETL